MVHRHQCHTEMLLRGLVERFSLRDNHIPSH